MEFQQFNAALQKQFKAMEGIDTLYRVMLDKDELWELYLKSFPKGTNPIYRERTEHDCSCCRNFIKNAGTIVTFDDDYNMVSLWDAPNLEGEYQVVAKALSAFVKSHPIDSAFVHYEPRIGVEKTFEMINGNSHQWNHFNVQVPSRYQQSKKAIDRYTGAMREKKSLLKRTLDTITLESIAVVKELIDQGSLYRGDQFKTLVQLFQGVLVEYQGLENHQQEGFLWTTVSESNDSIIHFKNSVIGTLVQDIASGMDLEAAVRSYEAKTAPQNYKRPTALITQSMVDRAKEDVEKLGLTSALERRYAVPSDIHVNDVLFVDTAMRPSLINGSAFDELATSVKSEPKQLKRVEEIGIEDFVENVLPNADTLELMFDHQLQGNLVSLIAPVDASANAIFQWDNLYSWSYNGDVTDSIKERVKQAGGNVTGEVCCRLSWSNYDDLDLHMIEPDGNEIDFGSKLSRKTGGRLDVDMNAGSRQTREPVENIYYNKLTDLAEGRYRLFVRQFHQRETVDVGFEVEFDVNGQVRKYSYPQAIPSHKNIDVVSFDYSKKDGIKVVKSLPEQSLQKEVWGINTGQFHRVNLLTLSPNFWGGKRVGHKHYFFALDNCANPLEARGFYNEFLNTDLKDHRKVFEVLGSRIKAPHQAEQVSGLGFSESQRSSVVCRVKGSLTRTLKINF